MIRPFQGTKVAMMRGTDEASGALFSYLDLDERVTEPVEDTASARG